MRCKFSVECAGASLWAPMLHDDVHVAGESSCMPQRRHPRVLALKLDALEVSIEGKLATPMASASPCSSAGGGIQERLRWPAPPGSRSPARPLKLVTPKASPTSVVEGVIDEQTWPIQKDPHAAARAFTHLKDLRSQDLTCVHDADMMPPAPLSGLSPSKANRLQPKIAIFVPSPIRIASLKLLEGGATQDEPSLEGQRCVSNDALPLS